MLSAIDATFTPVLAHCDLRRALLDPIWRENVEIGVAGDFAENFEIAFKHDVAEKNEIVCEGELGFKGDFTEIVEIAFETECDLGYKKHRIRP